MSRYRVALRSAGPDATWIRAFIQDIAAHESDIRDIAFFALFHEDLHRSFNEASKMMKKAESEATCIVQFLLHPRHHKYYLTDVARLHRTLQKDPRTVLVYDMADIPAPKGNGAKLEVVDQCSLDLVLGDLRNVFDPNRIMDRAAGVAFVAKVTALG